jgi:hypothetical protein
MSDPTIINNTGGGGGGAGWAIVVVLILAIAAALLFGSGVLDDLRGTKIDVSVDTPKVDAPSTPPASGGK